MYVYILYLYIYIYIKLVGLIKLPLRLLKWQLI